jgi:hypothetical protein
MMLRKLKRLRVIVHNQDAFILRHAVSPCYAAEGLCQEEAGLTDIIADTHELRILSPVSSQG